jgi:hypothetical protein
MKRVILATVIVLCLATATSIGQREKEQRDTERQQMAAETERLRTIAHGAIVALCQEAPEHGLCQPPAGAHGWCEHDWQELAPLYCD